MSDSVPDAPDADAAGRDAAVRDVTVPDALAPDRSGRPAPAPLSEEPPTGGLTAILGKLRDAAAAHDDEPGTPGRPGPG
jgi:hypothetical protein